MPVDRHETDILIIGSGGAGLFGALHAQQAAPDARITLAVKGLIGKSGCTRMVQGGYNVSTGPGDTVERHFMDTINGGKWLPNQDMAWKLCEQAVVRIRELENEVGCFFDRNADGSLHQKAFAGQTADRGHLPRDGPFDRDTGCDIVLERWRGVGAWAPRGTMHGSGDALKACGGVKFGRDQVFAR